jgi:hypothetical protein
MKLIRDYTSCFGPKRLGSNILINKFNESSKSFFRVIETVTQDFDILPRLDE